MDYSEIAFFFLRLDDDDYQDAPPSLPPHPLDQEKISSNGLDPKTEDQKIKATLLNNFSKLDKARWKLSLGLFTQYVSTLKNVCHRIKKCGLSWSGEISITAVLKVLSRLGLEPRTSACHCYSNCFIETLVQGYIDEFFKCIWSYSVTGVCELISDVFIKASPKFNWKIILWSVTSGQSETYKVSNKNSSPILVCIRCSALDFSSVLWKKFQRKKKCSL